MSTAGTANHGRIAVVYTLLAIVYDIWTWFTESKSLHAAVASVAIADGEAVLEVAVGTGVVFREILRRNPYGRNIGIDITKAMLRRTRRKANGCNVPFGLSVGDACSLPFQDGNFDIVLNNNMLGLLPEREFAPILSEMVRVLRPGGRLVIVMMLRPENRMARWIYQFGAVWLGCWRQVHLEPFLRTAGFESVRHYVVTQLGIPSEILQARKPAVERIQVGASEGD
jgi:ubiquinone/menaquinone biosynthesis C-methylase UbiE